MKHVIIAVAFVWCSLVFAQDLGGKDVTKENKDEHDRPNVVGTIQDGVYFVEPKDGATVAQKFKVKFGVHGMRIKPAGEIEIGSGHHHLIIEPFVKGKKPIGVPEKSVIAKDATHIHYGKGQEEDELSLKPGKYYLTLQFADGAHLSYGPKWAKTITITVK